MFEFKLQILNECEHKYRLFEDGKAISFAQTVNYWQTNQAFRHLFTQRLQTAGFEKYHFETPPLTTQTEKNAFEFILIDSPWLTDLADPHTYQPYFAKAGESQSVVSFENLGKDALLIAPMPSRVEANYAHIAAFMRSAQDSQIQGFWQRVGDMVQHQLSSEPLWLNTAGGGVAWLHIRLDSHPKDYSHKPYKRAY